MKTMLDKCAVAGDITQAIDSIITVGGVDYMRDTETDFSLTV